jgi:small subunit ribosomal protein S6
MASPKNTYELTYIVSGVLSEDQTKEAVARVRKYIEEHDGEIIEMDEWGTRRLNYPINKKRTGYYVNMHFHADGDLITRFERQLTIDESILRFLTLRLDAKMLRHYEKQRAEGKKALAEAAAAAAALPAPATDDEDED